MRKFSWVVLAALVLTITGVLHAEHKMQACLEQEIELNKPDPKALALIEAAREDDAPTETAAIDDGQ